MTLSAGTVLASRYRVASLLGQGGFGAVYRGWDITLSRLCAIKENFDISEDAQRQFLREATVLANLTHSNLPRVNDHFYIPGQGQYLVMDFIEGEDLDQIVSKKGAIEPELALDWITQVLDALVYLHSRTPPVIHRDIKPANIKITSEGKAFLVDFGLVKLYDPHMRTTAGARAITAGFSPPEQYGQAATDTRTDIYALGATLYMLLTCTPPMESVLRMTQDDLMNAHQVNPAIPIPVSKVIEKGMALRPDLRFQTANDFLFALKAAREESVQVPVKRPARHIAKPASSTSATAQVANVAAQPAAGLTMQKQKIQRKPIILGSIAGVLILLCVAGVFIWNGMLNGGIKSQFTAKPTIIPTEPELKATEKIAETKVSTPGPEVNYFPAKVCILGDGPTNDGIHNQVSWEGAQKAREIYGVEIEFLQADTSTADPYFPVVQKALDIECTLIVGNSFTWAESVSKMAKDNPNRKFALADSQIESPLPNVIETWFEISQSSFLAGYLSAGYSRTGIVATFGGMDIPIVINFMHGYALGVEEYNRQHSTNVKVLGWDTETLKGTFMGDFWTEDLGKQLATGFVDEGADIILPAAGIGNLEAMQVCMSTGKCLIIGVDFDATRAYSDYSSIILASSVRKMDEFIVEATRRVVKDEFSGGLWKGTMDINGVDLIINPAYRPQIKSEVLSEISLLRQKIEKFEIKTYP